MSQKKVTFDDIARYTNFSKTTISRYFNNPDSLTLKNQEIIAQALIDLDYKENKVAKILASGKTEFVGVIVPNLYLHYYSEMLNQILSSYEKFGYKFLVFTGNSNEAIERQYIQELLAYNIEGMIVLFLPKNWPPITFLLSLLNGKMNIQTASIPITIWVVSRRQVC